MIHPFLLAGAGFIRSKWLPLLVACAVIMAAGTYLRISGYNKGVAVTEAKAHKAMNEALLIQLAELERVNAQDVRNALASARAEFEVIQDVESIPIPTFPDFECPPPVGSADPVPVARKPDYSGWLRFFNAAVPGPDPTRTE